MQAVIEEIRRLEALLFDGLAVFERDLGLDSESDTLLDLVACERSRKKDDRDADQQNQTFISLEQSWSVCKRTGVLRRCETRCRPMWADNRLLHADDKR